MAKKENVYVKKKHNGSFHYAHKDCGGQLAIEATGWKNLPVGFGFHPGETKFAVDYVKVNLVKGFCMTCGVRGEFREPYGKNKKVKTSYPKVNK